MNPAKIDTTNASKIVAAIHFKIRFSFIGLTRDNVRSPPAEAHLEELAPLRP